MHNIYVDWNDLDGLRKVFKENAGQIAAVISQPYMHGNFADNVMPAAGFWQEVRKMCTENGTVLVVDDVRAGFRLDIAGSDHYFGFEADLICFCKALANGYNVSALCGKNFLKNTVSGMSYTGSYWLSAVPFAAGIACINKNDCIWPVFSVHLAQFWREMASAQALSGRLLFPERRGRFSALLCPTLWDIRIRRSPRELHSGELSSQLCALALSVNIQNRRPGGRFRERLRFCRGMIRRRKLGGI